MTLLGRAALAAAMSVGLLAVGCDREEECVTAPTCDLGHQEIADLEACSPGRDCYRREACGAAIVCEPPIDGCTEEPRCDVGHEVIGSTAECPDDASCYQRSVCDRTIVCRGDCTERPQCDEGHAEIASIDACAPGASCYARSRCATTIACEAPSQDCTEEPACDEGDTVVTACATDASCYERAVCERTILCLDVPECDPNATGATEEPIAWVELTDDASDAISEVLRRRYRDDRSISEEEFVEVRDAIVARGGPFTPSSLGYVRSVLETNNGTLYPDWVQRRTWAFLHARDITLRDAAHQLERDGVLDEADAATLLAMLDQTPLTGARRQTLFAIVAFARVDDAAAQMLRAHAETLPLQCILAAARADGTVTEDEWFAHLRGVLEVTPAILTPVADAFLELRYATDVVVPEAALNDMTRLLVARGYPVFPAIPGFDTAAKVRAAHILAVDTFFETLAARAGRTEGTISIGLLDGGFTLEHPGLRGRAWVNPREIAGNGVDDDANGFTDDIHGMSADAREGVPVRLDDLFCGPFNCVSHGTHVLGIALLGTDRVKPILAATYANRLPPAVEYAISNGARIVSFSMGVSDASVAPMLAAIEAHPEILFVQSAGNNGARLGEGEFSPDRALSANDRPNFVRVSSLDEMGELLRNSNYGAPYASVAAPARYLSMRAWEGGLEPEGYDYTGATSQAAPRIANLAAKMLLLAPSLTSLELKAMLLRSSTPREGWAERVAAGGPVHFERALALAATTQLVRDGATLDAALTRLALDADLAMWVAMNLERE